jgi:hypothetical protein
MNPLHAPDPMGKAAHEAAMFAHLLDFRLLAAASPSLPREERAASLRKALTQWPKLCRAMSELAMTAPATSSQAEADDTAMRDWIDARPNPTPLTEDVA